MAMGGMNMPRVMKKNNMPGGGMISPMEMGMGGKMDYGMGGKMDYGMGGKMDMGHGGDMARAIKIYLMRKGGKTFPDLTGDGKVTFADILKGRKVKLKKKSQDYGGKVMEQGGESDPPPADLGKVTEPLSPGMTRPGILFGTRKEIKDDEGNVIGRVRDNSKLRKFLSGGVDTKAVFQNGGAVNGNNNGDEEDETTDATPQQALEFLARQNPGVEVVGSSADRARSMFDDLGNLMGSTTAVESTAQPIRGIFIPPGESDPVPVEEPVSTSPQRMRPISRINPNPIPTQRGPKLLKRDFKEQAPEDMEQFTYIPDMGNIAQINPGRGYVSTGPRGRKRQINFSTESLARYIFENQRPTGKVREVGRDSAGRPITEPVMPFPSIEDAYKEAEKMSSSNIPGAKEYDIFDFIERAGTRQAGLPSNFRASQR